MSFTRSLGKGLKYISPLYMLSSLLGGKNSQAQESPQQSEFMNLLNSLMSEAKEPVNFEPFAKQAQTLFNQETIPGLAERFAAATGTNPGGSPLFTQQLQQAGSGLQESLAAMGAQQANLNKQNTLKMLLGLLNKAPESMLFPQQEPSGGFGRGIGEGIANVLPLLGMGAGMMFGQPALGGMAGKAAGSLMSGAAKSPQKRANAGVGMQALLSSIQGAR